MYQNAQKTFYFHNQCEHFVIYLFKMLIFHLPSLYLAGLGLKFEVFDLEKLLKVILKDFVMNESMAYVLMTYIKSGSVQVGQNVLVHSLSCTKSVSTATFCHEISCVAVMVDFLT
jgi:hypothetical protein